MATKVALAAEEYGKIVSAGVVLRCLKSYLPSHSTYNNNRCCILCVFADTTRMECAETKFSLVPRRAPSADTTRMECAEAKVRVISKVPYRKGVFI